jgi:hypothetical protein
MYVNDDHQKAALRELRKRDFADEEEMDRSFIACVALVTLGLGCLGVVILAIRLAVQALFRS